MPTTSDLAKQILDSRGTGSYTDPAGVIEAIEAIAKQLREREAKRSALDGHLRAGYWADQAEILERAVAEMRSVKY